MKHWWCAECQAEVGLGKHGRCATCDSEAVDLLPNDGELTRSVSAIAEHSESVSACA
jgi:hypothetical protein